MATELVALLAIYAFIMLGAFLGEMGPVATFQKSTPRLAALIERNIATGTEWKRADQNGRAPGWSIDGQ